MNQERSAFPSFCCIEFGSVSNSASLSGLDLSLANGSDGFPTRMIALLLVFVLIAVPCVVQRIQAQLEPELDEHVDTVQSWSFLTAIGNWSGASVTVEDVETQLFVPLLGV